MDHFDIVERVEMGQMASMFFNKGKARLGGRSNLVPRSSHLKGDGLLWVGRVIPLILIGILLGYTLK